MSETIISDVILKPFVRGYLACALWSSTDGDDNPMDRDYSESDLAPEAVEKATRDCAAFIEKAGNMLDGESMETAGHDFWLTRNRHGAGFWDGDYPEHGDALTTLSHGFGETDLYVGDDGNLYFSR